MSEPSKQALEARDVLEFFNMLEANGVIATYGISGKDDDWLMEQIKNFAAEQVRLALEQCAIEAGERTPDGKSSGTMLGDMWDKRIRALIPAQPGGER